LTPPLRGERTYSLLEFHSLACLDLEATLALVVVPALEHGQAAIVAGLDRAALNGKAVAATA